MKQKYPIPKKNPSNRETKVSYAENITWNKTNKDSKDKSSNTFSMVPFLGAKSMSKEANAGEISDHEFFKSPLSVGILLAESGSNKNPDTVHAISLREEKKPSQFPVRGV